MGQRGHVLDRFDRKTGLLQGRDRVFTTAPGTFHFHFDFLHTAFDRFFRSLLGGHLTGKRSAFSTALETAGSGGRPTQSIPLGVRNGNRRVIEGRFDMSDSGGYISSNFFLFRCFRHFFFNLRNLDRRDLQNKTVVQPGDFPGMGYS